MHAPSGGEPSVVQGPKICILTETYHPVVGGGETQARALAEGLASRNFQVSVITRRSDPSLPPREQIGGVRVLRLPPTGPGQSKKWGLLVSSGLTLLRRQRHYDLILVAGFRVLGIPALLVGTLLGKRCILKADSLGEMSGEFFRPGLARVGLDPSSPVFRGFLTLRNRLLRGCDGFVAISSAVEAELLGQGVPADSIRGIPNSVDTATFVPVDLETKRKLREQLGLPLTSPIATYCGRLVSYKGLPLLVRVWKEIRERRRDALLLLVGSGGLDIHNCEAELRSFVEEAGLQEAVRFTGAVHDVRPYLQASDVFVMPTEQEAFGIAIVEAMACGLAVISTDAAGVRDIVVDGENGCLLPPGDAPKLADAVELLLRDPHLRTRLGDAARQRAERYAEATIVARYIELFESLTTRRDIGDAQVR